MKGPSDLASLSLEDLRALPVQDVRVLTVNNRLARTLKAALASELQAGTVELMAIEPWSAWLGNQVVQRLFESPLPSVSQVLDAQSVKLIWADVIESCEDERSLVDIDQAAALAAEADALLLNWHVIVPETAHTPDYDRFITWRHAYESRVHALEAVDLPRLTALVAQWVRQGSVTLPKHLVLLGFTEFAPAMQDVLTALDAAGVQLRTLCLPDPASSPPPRVIACPTPMAQWQAAVQWARQSLLDNPQGHYAIVVPSLQAQAGLARRILQRELGPRSDADGLSFNVSVAPPLSEWSLARAMLAWLNAVIELQQAERIEPATAGQALIAGACAGSESEAGQRAMIDAGWRSQQTLVVTSAQWAQSIESLPLLSAAWRDVSTLWADIPTRKASWYEWANRFRRTLATLGFPGETTQSSVSYQLTAAIDRLISSLAVLDDWLAEPDAKEAWRMLARLARQTPFQPQRDRHARLDVLGLLEAEGGRWDGVWVMGVTDDVLPAVVSPNPLIPAAALVAAGAPRASAQREHEWAQHLMQALQCSAPSVTFSWPAREGEQPKRPSPLIAAFATAPSTGGETPVVDRVSQAIWIDEPNLPVRLGEFVGGGVSALEQQARNPMWAFFEYRLGARGLPAHADWPSSADRGKLLHKVMEVLWLRWKTQATMVQVRQQAGWADELRQIVSEQAVSELAGWPVALRQLECDRAFGVIEQWLDLEMTRPPFEVLESEKRHVFVQDTLALRVAIDRVDRLPDGTILLIDYKSGKSLPDPKTDWQWPALRNLQLLAYAGIMRELGQTPGGLVWVQLHAADVRWLGLSEQSLGLEGVTASEEADWLVGDWDAQLSVWIGQVRQLAHEFAQGRHENRFWRRDDMEYCTIKPLLRLHEDATDE